MKHFFKFFLFILLIISSINSSIAQWIKTNGLQVGSVSSFIVSGSNLFAGTALGVLLSTNDGTSWTVVNSGLTTDSVWSLAVSPNGSGGSNLFAGTSGGVFRSTNDGTNWIAVNSGLTSTSIRSLAVSPNGSGGSNLFAGTESGIFISTNDGASWTQTGMSNGDFRALALSGTNFFAGAFGGGVFLSTNDGVSWNAINAMLPNTYIVSLAVKGTNLFAGTQRTLFFSSDNGTSWAAVNNSGAQALAVSDTNLFAGNSTGVFLSTDDGTSWKAFNTGLTDTSVSALFCFGTNLFTGTAGGNIFKRPIADIFASVERIPNGLPIHFNLKQNYPNPFNPVTSISFEIPSKSFVSLKIFDVLGKEVATIVSEELLAGNYLLRWNAAYMPSGIYYYRLQAGSLLETKKLVLLK